MNSFNATRRACVAAIFTAPVLSACGGGSSDNPSFVFDNTSTKFSGNSKLLQAINTVPWNAVTSAAEISSALFGHILVDGGITRLYSGGSSPDGKSKIGYTQTSNPLLTSGWVTNPTPVLTASTTEGNFDSNGVETPSVIKVAAGDYRMWFTGVDAAGLKATGYATSRDGLTWVKRASPVFVGSQISWSDGKNVFQPRVILDNGVFRMWFTSITKDKLKWNIGYATSADGINWVNQSNSPVMKEDTNLRWANDHTDLPTVIKDGDIFHMWFVGATGNFPIGIADTTVAEPQVAYSKSLDGINWDPIRATPVVPRGAPGEWDADAVAPMDVVKVDGKFLMLYAGLQFKDPTKFYAGMGVATLNGA